MSRWRMAAARLAVPDRPGAAAAPHGPSLPGGMDLCHPAAGTRRGSADGHDAAEDMVEAALAGRRALVVDDEPMILEILAEHCLSLGMEVSEAADGEGALRQIEVRPAIDVLITDIRMPGLDGLALAERALALRPDMKVIFVTGYTTHRSSAWPILRKPFDLDDLEDALRRALVPRNTAPD